MTAAPTATRCLVVDDEALVRRSVVRMLEPLGFSCLEAATGKEALDALDETGELPLIVSDLRMPELDGMGFLAEVRRRWPDTAVVMLSGVAETSTAVEALQLGAADWCRPSASRSCSWRACRCWRARSRPRTPTRAATRSG